jgi:hypothetical protein
MIRGHCCNESNVYRKKKRETLSLTVPLSQQFLWALLVMSLTGNMIHNSWSGTNSAPSIINYTMFCAVWAMLTLFYLIPATVKDSFQIHAALPFALDLLNTIFWFCAAVAFAAKLGAHSCSDAVSPADEPRDRASTTCLR